MPERQCDGCKKQVEWGCYARKVGDGNDPDKDWENPAYLPVEIDGEDTYACPRQSIRESPRVWARALFFFEFFQQGHLPDRGSIVDQSASLMTWLSTMRSANNKAEEQLIEESRKQGDPRKR